MADNYGIDIQALDDLPDPEVLISGGDNLAYALGRRLLTPPGALDEIGDEEYDSIDLRGKLGSRLSTQDVRDLRTAAAQVMSADERVAGASVDLALSASALKVAASASSTGGPVDLVLSVDGVSASLLRSR